MEVPWATSAEAEELVGMQAYSVEMEDTSPDDRQVLHCTDEEDGEEDGDDVGYLLRWVCPCDNLMGYVVCSPLNHSHSGTNETKHKTNTLLGN